MKPEAFQSALSALQGDSPPRVWSLIVTVFGDLAQAKGDALTGPVLSDILTPLGIKPEAMRVSLHRLRNEGWLTAQKRGRMSLHVLGARGLEESAQASGRIYRNFFPAIDEWHIRCCAPGNGLPSGYVLLAPGIGLANAPVCAADTDDLVFEGRAACIPPWVMSNALPKGLHSELRDLDAAMDFVLAELQKSARPNALQSACLRAAIVHRWRRLILKVPDVPDAFFGADWIGLTCRAKVHDALGRLPRPDLNELG